MPYIEVSIPCTPEESELLVAVLSLEGYDSFAENDDGINAYIPEEEFNEEILRSLLTEHASGALANYRWNKMEEKNWNEEWEKNFEPVIVSDRCIVRASFHVPDKKYDFDIEINPKMSFGTGHHETTHMMLEHQLEIDHQDKIVMDAGSGTGILAIMASKSGAKVVEAFDIEDWAFENLNENVNLNGCGNISIYQGTIKELSLKNPEFDLILANINKNVLLAEISEYSRRLKKEGLLLLSGFYRNDNPDIIQEANNAGLTHLGEKSKNNWSSLLFKKI